jgi:hypothetical protein
MLPKLGLADALHEGIARAGLALIDVRTLIDGNGPRNTAACLLAVMGRDSANEQDVQALERYAMLVSRMSMDFVRRESPALRCAPPPEPEPAYATDTHQPPARPVNAVGDKLFQAEQAFKEEQVEALRCIARAAGDQATLIRRIEREYGDDAGPLIHSVLARGNGKTLYGHVRRWTAYANWCKARGLAVFPPTPERVTKYIAARIDAGCAPGAPDTVRGTVRWMAARLGMEYSEERAPELRATAEAHLATKDVLHEAVPFPLSAV